MRHLLPFLSWPKLTPTLARSEALAGLTVVWIMIPQGLAYALLAGMPPMSGLITAFVAALVAALFGASATLSTGPAALSCILIGTSIAGLTTNPALNLTGTAMFSADWVMLAVWLALLSGAMQLLLGALRFGWVIQLISSPVMMGFTQAAACLIMWSQVPALLGVRAADIQSLGAVFQNLNLWTISFGFASLLVLFLSKQWHKAVPWMLLVLMVFALASYAFDYSMHAPVVGALPLTIPKYSLSVPSWTLIEALLLPAAVIALVSFLEAASSAKIEHQRFGTQWNDSQDLIGQGMAKIAAGFAGGFPSSASFSRSAINLGAGARTPWSSVFMVALGVLMLILAAPVLALVPRAGLSAVVIMAVFSLLKPNAFMTLWRVSKTECMIAGLTFVATLVTAPDLYWGVLLGALAALAHFLYQRLHPRMIEVGMHADGSLRDRILWTLPPLSPSVYAVRMDAALDFASAASFERQVFAALAKRRAVHRYSDTIHQSAVEHVCIFAQPMNWIDATGVETLSNMAKLLRSQGIYLHLSGLKSPVEKALDRAEAVQSSEWVRRYRSEAETICALQALSDVST